MPQIKGKRVLKNGALAGYVKQRDGSWKWTFLKGGSPSPVKKSPTPKKSPNKSPAKKASPKKNRTPKPWLMTKNELNKARTVRDEHEKVFLEELAKAGGDLQKMFTKGTVVATPKVSDKSILLTIDGAVVDKLLEKYGVERQNSNKRSYYNIFLAHRPEGLEVNDAPIKVKFGNIYCVKNKTGAPSPYKFCGVDLDVDDEKFASLARVILNTRIRIFDTKLPYKKTNRHNVPNKNVKKTLENMAKRNSPKKNKSPNKTNNKKRSPKMNNKTNNTN
jgi:hypothetical protein